jgi:hypothetical protein
MSQEITWDSTQVSETKINVSHTILSEKFLLNSCFIPVSVTNTFHLLNAIQGHRKNNAGIIKTYHSKIVEHIEFKC